MEVVEEAGGEVQVGALVSWEWCRPGCYFAAPAQGLLGDACGTSSVLLP